MGTPKEPTTTSANATINNTRKGTLVLEGPFGAFFGPAKDFWAKAMNLIAGVKSDLTPSDTEAMTRYIRARSQIAMGHSHGEAPVIIGNIGTQHPPASNDSQFHSEQPEIKKAA